MVYAHGMQSHFDVCLMKHNQQGRSEAETSQCLPKPRALINVGTVGYFDSPHCCSLLLAYVMESNVVAFTGKGDAAYPLPVGHLSFPGMKRTGTVQVFGEIKLL